MPNGVANGFSHNRFRVTGQSAIDNRQRADKLDCGAQLGAGELGAMASSSRVTPDAAQVEGRRADLLNDVLQIVYAARKAVVALQLIVRAGSSIPAISGRGRDVPGRRPVLR